MTAKEIYTRAELAMMGRVVKCNNDEVQEMTDYICKVLNKSPVPFVNGKIQRYDDNKVTYLVCNRVCGMTCITYLLETPDAPKPFEEDYGTGYPCAFCYVLNLVDDTLSEFGDCFFQLKSDKFYHRIG